ECGARLYETAAGDFADHVEPPSASVLGSGDVLARGTPVGLLVGPSGRADAGALRTFIPARGKADFAADHCSGLMPGSKWPELRRDIRARLGPMALQQRFSLGFFFFKVWFGTMEPGPTR